MTVADRSSDAVVYLTFDDGPHPTLTPAILDVLAVSGARATFFQIGRLVSAHPELTRRVVAEGHTIGNHTWSHPDLSTVSQAELRSQLVSTSHAIAEASGQSPTLFRPPYGRMGETPEEKGAIMTQAAALGMATFLWEIDTLDWEHPGAESIVASVVDNVAPNVIVLMHDGECADGAANVAAVEKILAALAADGYRFASLASV